MEFRFEGGVYMKDKIHNAIKGSKADYTEIRIEERQATTVIFRGEDLETANHQ